MSRVMSQFIERHTRLFREGRIEEMLDDCEFPLAVQGADGLEVLITRDNYRDWLHDWKRELSARKMHESKLRIHTLELPRAGRFRVWIERSFEDTDCARLDLTVIYYCRLETPRPVIEMIEFSAVPQPAP